MPEVGKRLFSLAEHQQGSILVGERETRERNTAQKVQQLK